MSATFITIFEETVKKYPEYIAIYDHGSFITYIDLNKKVNQFARYLISLSLAAETRIGVLSQTNLDTISCLLAIWKAGHCYLPLDASLPTERLKYFINDSGCQLILSDKKTELEIMFESSTTIPTIISYDELKTLSLHFTDENLNLNISKNQLAYLIYTSGTTGTPKGVAIEHRGLPNCFNFAKDELTVTSKDRIALYASIGFDAHLWQMMLALGSGSSLYIIPAAMRLDISQLGHYYTQHQISIAVFSPTFLASLSSTDFKSVRILITTGENVTENILTSWHSEHRIVINGYGPTEASIATSLGKYIPHQGVHIGTAGLGFKIFIVDSHLNPLPQGETGELVIAGEGLSRGYWGKHLAELNKKRFILINSRTSTTKKSKIRVFRTHDLAVQLPCGNFVLKGRIDRQLKVNGQLVCPEEIERAIYEADDTIQQVYVTPNIQNNQIISFNAYVAAKSRLNLKALHSILATKLPHYMRPSYYGCAKSLPISSNGKVAHTLLYKIPTVSVAGENENKIFPRNQVEEIIYNIWKKELSLDETIGITDNFFELGGTSLKFASILVKINTLYPKLYFQLSFVEFSINPTIASLARKINRLINKKLLSPMIQLQAGIKCNNALFFIHDITGNLQTEDLRFHLGPKIPFFGLKSRGLDNILDLDETIEATATDYVNTIRHKQPEGPYNLLGWSTGGAIAYEMAKQFDSQGDSVNLFIIDSICPSYMQQFSDEKFTFELILLLQALAKIIGINCNLIELQKLKNNCKSSQINYGFNLLRHTIEINNTELNVNENIALDWLEIAKILWLANYSYQIKPINVNKYLFISNDTATRIESDTLGWDSIPSEHIYRFNSNHFNILRRSELAAILTKIVNNSSNQ